MSTKSSLRKEFEKQLSSKRKELLIKEAILAVLAEQAIEQQQQQPAPAIQAPNPPTSPDQSQAPQPEEEVTIDSVIEKLNVIRGGTSFSDPEVYGQLNTFFNNLPEDQRVNLDNQLNNIGKIVSMAEPDEAQPQTNQPAPTPQAPPVAPPAQPTSSAPIAPAQPGF